MNPYSIPTFITSCLVFSFGLIVYNKNRINKANEAFFYVCFATAVWQFLASIAYNLQSKILAESFMRVCYLGVNFLPITVFHFIGEFLNINKLRKLYPYIYMWGGICGILILTTDSLIAGLYEYFWGFYPMSGKYHPIIVLTVFLCVGIADILLILHYFRKDISLTRKNQIKYVLIAEFIFNFTALDFIPNYGIESYPSGFLFTTIFISIIAYSIIKYRLLDVSLAVTKTGIFVAVYSLVLGIPFAIAFGWHGQLKVLVGELWWLVPLISSTILATVGPFIYLYIQRKAEDRLLQEQRRYQATLRRASLGMGRIKDLNRLLKLTVNIITRNVQIEHAAIYLTHPPSGRYILKALKGRETETRKQMFIPGDSSLVAYLKKHREPLVYDEIKQRSQDFQDKNLVEICQAIEELHGALLIPSFIEEDLIAIVVLGNKKSGKLYSHDDLVVFSILANQAALGIENAQFYEEMKKTHEQLMKAEKMATIGTMADGLSHQINNRLHAMGFITGDLLDTIKLKRTDNMPPETKALLDEAEHSLGRIQDNVKRGGEIVEGLLKYSRKADEGLTAVDLNKLLDASIEMAQFKIKINQIDIIRNFSPSLSKIRGNFTQLQEVFFNMIDNAYDAMMERKEGMKEPAYRGRLEISAKEEGNHLEILLRDNGIGVKDKDFKRLFTPFFTTKITSKKGTGLGLYVIRKIIEENHGGKVEFTSEYQKGSQTRLLLPAFRIQS